MTDDAELRARIAAQVAARRADAASSDVEETDLPPVAETVENRAPGRGGKSLTPTRPWQRRGAGSTADPALDDMPEDPPADLVDKPPTTVRRGGVSPARPWAGRSARVPAADEPPVAPVEEPSADSPEGRLRPARPWQGRPAEPERAEPTPAPPAPSHPQVVLHGIGEEDAAAVPAPPPRLRGLLQRGAGKRRSDDPRDTSERRIADEARDSDLARQRAEAERRLAAEREEAQRVLAEERAAAERELAEQRAEAERLRVRREEERAAAERELAEQRAEAERLRVRREEERAAAERELAEQRAEAERLRVKREEERAAAERELAEQRAAAERQRAEAERLRMEREEAARQLAEQQAEAERQLAEQRAEAERQRAEAERLRHEREEAERILAERKAAMAELPETTAVYVPDDAAVGAFAEAAGALQDQAVDEADDLTQPSGRRGRRRRKTKEPPVAVPPAATAPEPAEPAQVEPAPAEVALASAEVAPAPDIEPPVPAIGSAELAGEDETYPWQQKDEVDLDLHGAQTWDPGMYPPEDEVPPERRSRRALRWLLARAPEPAAAEVAAPVADEALAAEPAPAASDQPAPPLDLPVAHLPVEDFITRDTADETAPAGDEPAGDEVGPEEPAVVDEAPAGEPLAAAEAELEPAPDLDERMAGKRGYGLFARLRRRPEAEREAVPEEEPEEAFALPPVDEAWLEPPKPTRDWTKRTAPIELGATPDELAAVVPEPEPAAVPEPETEPVAAVEPEPEPEPVAAVEPEPVAAVELEPEPEPEPEPTPAARPVPAARRRPSPGTAGTAGAAGAAAPARRPSPGLAASAAPAAAAAEPAASAGEPRRRPSPGIAAAASAGSAPAASGASTASAGTASQSARPMPFELAGGATAAPSEASRKGPDLSRFLEATESDDDTDDDDDDDTGGGSDGRWRRMLIRTGVTLLIAVLAAVLLRVFIVQPYYIPSASMEPTLHGCPGCNDDHVLVDKISYDVHGVRVGDIVVFHKPPNAQVPEDVLIKRVIALGGQRISMRKGRVYVNGGVLDEGYLNQDHSCYATDPSENFGPRTVPAGDVFVMGDNRCNSEDSREFGPISTSSIIGRAFMIVWPLNRIQFLGS